MRKHLLAVLLELCLKEAAKDRDLVNLSGRHSVDQKRAVAHVYTKLKEAQMWMEEAKEYYETAPDSAV